ncbi:dihydrodipicolinate synthase family protein [Pseudomonas sp. 18175]|uniref:dihydrodipicolinate synthase family protein n=1 Tax=Pseudomonas sp. 18175 TaxID=3390056 RepID=UPI003D219132
MTVTTTLRAALDGISGILVTPFDAQDQIDGPRLKSIVDHAIDAGVHALVANGNTGEFYGLSLAEAKDMAQIAAAHIDGRVPLIAGVGRSIGDACDLAKNAKEVGASALMIHQPPDPFSAPRGFIDYVKRVGAASGGLPLILYLRNEAIGLAAIEELCRLPQVIGVKWASPTPMVLAEAIRRTADLDIAWVGGLAETWAPPFYAVGARGFTSGLINVFPARSVAIHNALEASDYATARTLINDMLPFEELRAEENNGTNVTVVKTALQMIGHDCGATRPPSAWPLTAKAKTHLNDLLVGWELVP